MNHVCTLVSVALVVALGGTAIADEVAEGRGSLVFVGGIGVDLISHTPTAAYGSLSESNDRENKVAMKFDMKLGYAPSDVLLIQLIMKRSRFSIENASGDDVSISYDLLGPGVTYFLEPAAPSVFFTGALGVSGFSGPEEDGAGTCSGPGVSMGAGYEFSPSFMGAGGSFCIEGDVCWGSCGSDFSTYALSVGLTLGVIWYVAN
jgi:hypothetical protein